MGRPRRLLSSLAPFLAACFLLVRLDVESTQTVLTLNVLAGQDSLEQRRGDPYVTSRTMTTPNQRASGLTVPVRICHRPRNQNTRCHCRIRQLAEHAIQGPFGSCHFFVFPFHFDRNRHSGPLLSLMPLPTCHGTFPYSRARPLRNASSSLNGSESRASPVAGPRRAECRAVKPAEVVDNLGCRHRPG